MRNEIWRNTFVVKEVDIELLRCERNFVLLSFLIS